MRNELYRPGRYQSVIELQEYNDKSLWNTRTMRQMTSILKV